MKTKKKVLIYALPQERQRHLTETMRQLQIVVIPVAPTQYAQPLRDLIAGSIEQHAAAFPWPAFAEPMLVMHGLESEEIDEVLAALRHNQIRIDLKAIVTPTNQTWTSLQLYGELCREREAMRRGS